MRGKIIFANATTATGAAGMRAWSHTRMELAALFQSEHILGQDQGIRLGHLGLRRHHVLTPDT